MFNYLVVLLLLQPGLHIWLPADVRIVREHHPTPRHGGRRSNCQILHLKQQGHLLGHRDTFTVNQRQDLVIVHHRVHALDPQCVHWPVKHQPLLVRLLIYSKWNNNSILIPNITIDLYVLQH